jgi:hypothetical protein
MKWMVVILFAMLAVAIYGQVEFTQLCEIPDSYQAQLYWFTGDDAPLLVTYNAYNEGSRLLISRYTLAGEPVDTLSLALTPTILDPIEYTEGFFTCAANGDFITVAYTGRTDLWETRFVVKHFRFPEMCEVASFELLPSELFDSCIDQNQNKWFPKYLFDKTFPDHPALIVYGSALEGMSISNNRSFTLRYPLVDGILQSPLALSPGLGTLAISPDTGAIYGENRFEELFYGDSSMDVCYTTSECVYDSITAVADTLQSYYYQASSSFDGSSISYGTDLTSFSVVADPLVTGGFILLKTFYTGSRIGGSHLIRYDRMNDVILYDRLLSCGLYGDAFLVESTTGNHYLVASSGLHTADFYNIETGTYSMTVPVEIWGKHWTLPDGRHLVQSENVFYTLPAELVEAGDQVAPTPQIGFHIAPNPFNPSTTISFSLTKSDLVDIGVYNLRGERVRTLADGTFTAGEHRILWNGCDDRGMQSASGVYIMRMMSGGKAFVQKTLLLK